MDDFDRLLERRDELRASHQAYCDDINGPAGMGEGSSEASARDRIWRELEALEEQIAGELAAAEEDDGVLLLGSDPRVPKGLGW